MLLREAEKGDSDSNGGKDIVSEDFEGRNKAVFKFAGILLQCTQKLGNMKIKNSVEELIALEFVKKLCRFVEWPNV